MKRPIAAILLLLFLFNALGYYGLYPLLRLHTTHVLNQRVDAGAYDSRETVVLKLPLSLPYLLAGQGEDHRLRGSLRHEGQLYTLVSQHIEADTLYVVCLPNRAEHRAASLLARFADPTHTLAAPLKAPKLSDNLAHDYTLAPILTLTLGHALQIHRYAIAYTTRWCPPAQRVITPPPERA
jgi:hypothetical protein